MLPATPDRHRQSTGRSRHGADSRTRRVVTRPAVAPGDASTRLLPSAATTAQRRARPTGALLVVATDAPRPTSLLDARRPTSLELASRRATALLAVQVLARRRRVAHARVRVPAPRRRGRRLATLAPDAPAPTRRADVAEVVLADRRRHDRRAHGRGRRRRRAPRAFAYREFPQHFPRPGWVEHDPDEIWRAVLDTLGEVVARRSTARPSPAIGITNQRETVVVWDRATGRPRHRAHRVAGPAHRGAVRRAARRGPRAARARAHRARARPLLLGHQARVAARARVASTPTPTSRSAPSTRGSSGTSPAAPTAACTRPSRRTRAARCSSTSTRSTGRRAARPLRRAPRRACPTVLPSSGRFGIDRSRRAPPGSRCRSAASPATSRRRCSARRASRRA